MSTDFILWSVGMIFIGAGIGIWLCSSPKQMESKPKAIDKNDNEILDWDEALLNDPDIWKTR